MIARVLYAQGCPPAPIFHPVMRGYVHIGIPVALVTALRKTTTPGHLELVHLCQYDVNRSTFLSSDAERLSATSQAASCIGDFGSWSSPRHRGVSVHVPSRDYMNMSIPRWRPFFDHHVPPVEGLTSSLSPASSPPHHSGTGCLDGPGRT
ncbi:uncharacterized protein SCHCODRAFT_02333680 [Schizophyllum commune H4-8]|uniref:uncharacterized protein n=1 Tax=Schizophyllum commune (strain H4-8 / FGSC 9210) TaxID=578458 RepID=UPI00215E8760|nr:uncharacterized protein SCHCODRAFT_02333680 [Schizophyllum commune H4-8]KAI5889980.1 hypothetical protein SCHCODRAFT_02333680 [Schizophyllum commune H4-8]